MDLTDDIFAKRGSWQLFRSVAGYDLSEAEVGHIDERGRLWLRLPQTLLCTDGNHLICRYEIPALHSCLRSRSGFCRNDRYWYISEDHRLHAVRLADGQTEDHTRFVPNLQDAFWMWTSDHEDILIGLPGRLLHYNGRNCRELKNPVSRTSRIHCGRISPDGQIWITIGTKLYCVDGDSFCHCPLPGVDDDELWEFLAGTNGTVWLPMAQKLVYLEKGEVKNVFKGEFAKSRTSTALLIDQDANAWFAVHFRGACAVNRKGMVLFPFEDTPGVWWPKCVVQDLSGAFWHIGVRNGLVRYNPRGMNRIQHGYIESITRDQSGTYIMAAASRGLLSYDGVKIQQPCKSLPTRIIYLYKDVHVGLLICGATGLAVYDEQTHTVQPWREMEHLGLGRGYVSVIRAVRDHDGRLWISTRDLLLCLGPDGNQVYAYKNLGLGRNSCIFCDEEGGLWALSGPDMPVLHYTDGVFRVVSKSVASWLGIALDGRIVRAGYDHKGGLWLVEDGGWILRRCPKTGQVEKVVYLDSVYEVHDVRFATDGKVWISTGDGLFIYLGGHIYRMLETCMLPSRWVLATYALDENSVLIATQLGVCKYSPRMDVSPEIYINEVQADRAYVVSGETLCCEASDVLSVVLIAWNSKPGPLVYRYRLLGAYPYWVESNDTACRFDHVVPGTYCFEAEAFDQDLVFCRERVRLELEVLPNQREAQIAALEGELQGAKAFAENIILSMHDMVVVLDVDGKITAANPAMRKLLGYSSREILGQSPDVLFFPHHVCPVDADGLVRLKDARYFEAQEVALRKKDGQSLPVIFSAVCLYDGRGSLQGFVLQASDISEYKVLQHQLIQSQKMKSLGMLAGGIAHDFNNLLSVMIGNADFIAADMNDDSAYRGNVNDIVSAGKQAAKLCSEMLTYCGKRKPQQMSLDLSAIVRENTELLKSSLSRKISIQYDLADDLPMVWGDEVQIMQVVLNLVMNASDAIGDQTGQIGLQTKLVAPPKDFPATTQRAEEEPSCVLLRVSDTGCGMDDATLEQIFEPFFTTKFTGRGLGLSAIQGIVQSHNGHMQVDSEVGKGTTFRVYLPVARPQELENAAGEDKGNLPESGTVLLVDDDAFVRKVAKQMLVRMGFCVMEAEDGEAAIEVFSAHRDSLSCVLLDITMPVMDGYEAYKQIREIDTSIPIAMLSGLSADSMEQKLAADPHRLYLPKPFTRQELADLIAQFRLA